MSKIEINSGEEKIFNKLSHVNNVLKHGGIGFDIDGSEVDTHTPAVRLYNTMTSHLEGFEPRSVSDIINYDAFVGWFEEAGFQEPFECAMDVWHDEEVIVGAEPLSGSFLLSLFLKSQDIDVYRITSRPAFVSENTRKWYKQWQPHVISEDLLHIQSETDNINPSYKSDKIAALGLGYFFEDSFEHAQSIVQNTDATVVLVPQPWNRDYKNDNPRIIVTSGFDGIPKLVRSYFSLAEHILKESIA